jgi:DNA-binding response OmpR family regulator
MDARPDALTAPSAPLSAQEMAVLQAFLDCQGRVISRLEIARRAGLTSLNSRRCDSILVALRRVLGPEAIRTVRSRGWMLEADALDEARRLLAV